jgi:hypothetical protein
VAEEERGLPEFRVVVECHNVLSFPLRREAFGVDEMLYLKLGVRRVSVIRGRKGLNGEHVMTTEKTYNLENSCQVVRYVIVAIKHDDLL